MINAYDAILSNHDVKQAITQAATVDDEHLLLAARALGERQFQKLGEIALHKLSVANTHHTIYLGGLLKLYQIAAHAVGQTHSFAEFIDELQIKKTKAYDAINVYHDFGQQLLANPKLMPLLPVEALKLLSRKNVSQETREDALKLAQAGVRVTIRRAMKLVEDHGCVSASAKKARHRQRTDAKPLWSFVGSAVRLTLVADDPKHVPGICVLQDLEAAIAAYRDQNFGDESAHDAA